MSNEIATETEDKELEEMRQQIEQVAEANKDQAAEPVIEPETPSPEPVASQAPEVAEPTPAPVTPTPSPVETSDNPMEWAKKKGFKSPEDMARALRQKEQEFHQSRQKAERENAPPPPPTWQPSPDMGYGYPPPPPQPREQFADQMARRHNLHPDDVRGLLPLIAEAADAIATNRTRGLERKVFEMDRQSSRNNELMSLMQDPAFSDPRVQKEIHEILESDKSAFQRDGAYTELFKQALENMARKQLQQGGSVSTAPTMGNTPPVTAGGGNGSANTVPQKITEKDFDSWTDVQQKAFINSNGRIVPKR